MQQNDVSIQTFPTLATAIKSNKFNQLSLQNGRKSFKHAFTDNFIVIWKMYYEGFILRTFCDFVRFNFSFFFKVKKIIEV